MHLGVGLRTEAELTFHCVESSHIVERDQPGGVWGFHVTASICHDSRRSPARVDAVYKDRRLVGGYVLLSECVALKTTREAFRVSALMVLLTVCVVRCSEHVLIQPIWNIRVVHSSFRVQQLPYYVPGSKLVDG